MNVKRAFLTLAAVMVLPVTAFAQTQQLVAAFTVDIDFWPANDGPSVTATMDCDAGTLLDASKSGLGDGDDVTFIAEFAAGANCSVSGSAVAGYETHYNGDCDADGDFPAVDSEGFADYACTIKYKALPVTFKVTKTWDITNDGGNALQSTYQISLRCDAEILECSTTGKATGNGASDDPHWNEGEDFWYCDFNEAGTPDSTYTAKVTSTGGDDVEPPSCWAVEDIKDSAVEAEDNCGSREISVGSTSSCTMTNTVFYEGIPTLSQYGLAIMALLMLGVGFVGFRRFV